MIHTIQYIISYKSLPDKKKYNKSTGHTYVPVNFFEFCTLRSLFGIIEISKTGGDSSMMTQIFYVAKSLLAYTIYAVQIPIIKTPAPIPAAVADISPVLNTSAALA